MSSISDKKPSEVSVKTSFTFLRGGCTVPELESVVFPDSFSEPDSMAVEVPSSSSDPVAELSLKRGLGLLGLLRTSFLGDLPGNLLTFLL